MFQRYKSKIYHGISVGIIALLLLSCTNKSAQEGQKIDYVYKEFSIVNANKVSSPKEEYWPAYIEADQTINVSSQLLATIEKVDVSEGDFVKSGQLIIKLDDKSIMQELFQSQSRLETSYQLESEAKNSILIAKNDCQAKKADLDSKFKYFKRIEELLNLKSATQDEFDRAESAYRISQSAYDAACNQILVANNKLNQIESQIKENKHAIEQIKIKLNYTLIKSPCDGYVVKKMVNPGDLASLGQSLVLIETARSKLVVNVPEEFYSVINRVKNDITRGPIEVIIENQNKEFKSLKISEIIPKVDSQTRTFKIKIELSQDSAIRSGMYAKLKFNNGLVSYIEIPQSAVVTRGQINYAYVVHQDGEIELRVISLGQKKQNSVVVISGLDSREKIIKDAPDEIESNIRVKL